MKDYRQLANAMLEWLEVLGQTKDGMMLGINDSKLKNLRAELSRLDAEKEGPPVIQQEHDNVPPVPEANPLNLFRADWVADAHTIEQLPADLGLTAHALSRIQIRDMLDLSHEHAAWIKRGEDTILLIQSRAHVKVFCWNNRDPRPLMRRLLGPLSSGNPPA